MVNRMFAASSLQPVHLGCKERSLLPMLVVMKPQATPEEIQAVCEQIQLLGFRAHPMPGAQRTAIGITGNSGAVDQGDLEELSGVAEVIRVSKPYKLVSRDVKQDDTVIR